MKQTYRSNVRLDPSLVKWQGGMKIYPIPDDELPLIPRATDLKGYKTSSGLTVMVSNDIDGDGNKVRHISMSHIHRLPTYYEMKDLRYRLCPDVKYMAQIFPPLEDFVNIHDNCLHLYEVEL